MPTTSVFSTPFINNHVTKSSLSRQDRNRPRNGHISGSTSYLLLPICFARLAQKSSRIIKFPFANK
jgi:hypothetical protein